MFVSKAVIHRKNFLIKICALAFTMNFFLVVGYAITLDHQSAILNRKMKQLPDIWVEFSSSKKTFGNPIIETIKKTSSNLLANDIGTFFVIELQETNESIWIATSTLAYYDQLDHNWNFPYKLQTNIQSIMKDIQTQNTSLTIISLFIFFEKLNNEYKEGLLNPLRNSKEKIDKAILQLSNEFNLISYRNELEEQMEIATLSLLKGYAIISLFMAIISLGIISVVYKVFFGEWEFLQNHFFTRVLARGAEESLLFAKIILIVILTITVGAILGFKISEIILLMMHTNLDTSVKIMFVLLTILLMISSIVVSFVQFTDERVPWGIASLGIFLMIIGKLSLEIQLPWMFILSFFLISLGALMFLITLSDYLSNKTVEIQFSKQKLSFKKLGISSFKNKNAVDIIVSFNIKFAAFLFIVVAFHALFLPQTIDKEFNTFGNYTFKGTMTYQEFLNWKTSQNAVVSPFSTIDAMLNNINPVSLGLFENHSFNVIQGKEMNSVMVSKELANSLSLKIGDQIRLEINGIILPLEIKGVFIPFFPFPKVNVFINFDLLNDSTLVNFIGSNQQITPPSGFKPHKFTNVTVVFPENNSALFLICFVGWILSLSFTAFSAKHDMIKKLFEVAETRGGNSKSIKKDIRTSVLVISLIDFSVVTIIALVLHFAFYFSFVNMPLSAFLQIVLFPDFLLLVITAFFTSMSIYLTST